MSKFLIISLSIIITLLESTSILANQCIKLWPSYSLVQLEKNLAVVHLLRNYANEAILHTPQSITRLGSAGKTSIHDKGLLASRRAMREADDAAILALLFQLTNDTQYLNAARHILLTWAKVNHPTGHPIDETRLAGLLWAYDLIQCQLTPDQKNIILAWLRSMREAKMKWKFGEVTNINNHRAHHLKMMLLLDKVLNNKQDDILNEITHFAKQNLSASTGESFDFKYRSALYYHNYILQAWLEITLVSKSHLPEVEKAFNFLIDRIRSGKINHEFSHSQAKIDRKREKGGFEYAKRNSTFDIRRAAPTILTYYTQHIESQPADLQQIVNAAENTPWVLFLKAREILFR